MLCIIIARSIEAWVLRQKLTQGREGKPHRRRVLQEQERCIHDASSLCLLEQRCKPLTCKLICEHQKATLSADLMISEGWSLQSSISRARG